MVAGSPDDAGLGRPLRVAMLSPIAWRTPPRHYGPWEQVVSLLTEGLVRRGVDVTLFATGDSLTSARLHSVCPVGYEEDPSMDAKVWESLHISEVFERAGEFDLIHNHFDFLPLTYSRLTTTPLVATIHGFSSDRILPVYRKYQDTAAYVAISDADRAPGLRYAATVHHGIDLSGFTFRADPGAVPPVLRAHPPGQGGVRGHPDSTPDGPSADPGRGDPGRDLLSANRWSPFWTATR